MSVKSLDADISAFNKMEADLKSAHNGMWVLIFNGVDEGVFDSFELTAENAVKRFGSGPYLIRRIGAPAPTLPASVLFHPTPQYAQS